jgi:predicted amidohydrolase YtcJ
MLDAGLLGFHENAAPHIGPETEIPLVRQAAAEAGLRVTVYWGELMALDTARRLGVAGLAGDLVADGAFGSRTAALAASYEDHATCGHAYLSAEQVTDHVVACTEAGLQAGFHCIGDAALEAIGAGFAAAAARVGTDRLRAARHRLEHVEMPSAETVGVLDDCGVVASVQPVFDALWGGPDAMYAARLGDRWRVTNPFAALATTRGGLAIGSDSPVTPLGPWAAIRAAVHHHAPEHRLTPAQAYLAHTAGSARAGLDDGPGGGGRLEVGARADLALWDCPAGLTDEVLPVLEPGADLPRVRRLWAATTTSTDPHPDDSRGEHP